MNFKIFPCAAKDRPLVAWKTQASNDPAQIAAWGKQFGANLKYWAIPCGEVNDILVLDVDTKGDGFNTLKSFPPIQTMNQRTPSGGAHFIFKYPKDGRKYGNTVKFLPGLDTRGVGGYIIWYGGSQGSIMEAPEWLLGVLHKREIPITATNNGDVIAVADSIAKGIIDESINRIREAPGGESNNVLNLEGFRIGQLVASGAIKRESAEDLLLKAAAERSKPQREARATIKSALDGGISKPLTSPFSAPQPVIDIPPPPKSPERWTPPLFSMEELLNTTKLKKPQLFKDWSTEDIHITTADGGTGKTTLKLFEAICLALGERFLGFDCVQPGGRTLFITGEDTEAKLGAMIGAICKQMGIIEDRHKMDIVRSSVVVKKDQDLCIISKDIKQGFLHPNLDAMTKVLQAVNDFKPKMIVFDPISSFWGSESALNDMAKAVSKFMMRLVDEANACVEMINHMSKQSSTSKDMTQFSGRGGTGLPSNARVSRAFRTLNFDEYTEMTGETLNENQGCILVNVGKFTDGSPLLSKPFIIVRDGYLFYRKDITRKVIEDDRNTASAQVQRIYNYILDHCKAGKPVSEKDIIAYFKFCGDSISDSKIKSALLLMCGDGWEGLKLQRVPNPDQVQGGMVYVNDRD